MSKKSFIVKLIIFVMLFLLVLPSFGIRVKNEQKNNDVVMALNYNNAEIILSAQELNDALRGAEKNGAGTALLVEETLNSLASDGYVTAIKYNVLCHKYDDESEAIIKQLENDKKIHNDSYVIITKRDECKGYLAKWIPARFRKDEYKKIETELGADVYVMYEGVGQAWQVTIGFDEKKLEHIAKSGLAPSLLIELGAYKNTKYIDEIGKLIEKYNVKFLNLKPNYRDKEKDKFAKENYTEFCKLIEKYNLYLVLTENPTQLANQNPIGYKALIKSAKGRVLRGYEAIDYDASITGETVYEKYYSQIINSVIDRNIRFVVVKQLTNGNNTIGEKGELTNEAIGKITKKLNAMGYNTKSYSMAYDYNVNRKLTSAAVMLLMILMCLMMLEWVMKKAFTKIRLLAAAGGLASVAITFIAPESILNLYPTLFAIVAPCFCIFAVMIFIKNIKEKTSPVVFFVLTIVMALALMLICATVQASLLSGLDYYLNILTFKGIKISLMAPILFSLIVYGITFTGFSYKTISRENIKKVLFADIKVYWVLAAGVVLFVAMTYIRRSGNVTTISSIEALMRNTITELMEARPRTKEFLVGWPAFVLFIYYIKNTKCTVLQWVFATASGILFASVMNSFCHVFTGVATIYMRVLNGILIGAVVSAAALIINHIIILIIKKYIIKERQR